MSDNTIAFIIPTNNDKLYNKCKSYIDKLKCPDGIISKEIIPITTSHSMCSAYNTGMKQSKAKYKVYLHQDLFILDEDFLIKMINAFKSDSKLGILGIAGCTKLPESCIWWDNINSIVGIWYDSHSRYKELNKYRTNADNVITVDALDGCILCTQYDIDWREDIFDGWDFYDISQCYEFKLRDYTCGIIPGKIAMVYHDCGTCDMSKYHHYRDLFKNLYKSQDKVLDIFVACAGGATGGIELLHQLVYELNKTSNVNATIWYPPSQSYMKGNDPAYKKYNSPFTNSNKFKDTDILIFPEIWANDTNKSEYSKNKKFIYWESVDNYFVTTPKSALYKFPNNVSHMVQSYYAYDFLVNKCNISKDKIIFITDYLNESYLESYIEEDRLDQVLYNPKKGLVFTNLLIKNNPDIKFIPIKNMTNNQVIELMHRSKLYIDFGNHPGKDRIPREAAISGCCVITGLDGAAKFKEDVNIPDFYKVDKDNTDIQVISDKIHYILSNYEACTKDFNTYRESISNEYSRFSKEVKELIIRLRNHTI